MTDDCKACGHTHFIHDRRNSTCGGVNVRMTGPNEPCACAGYQPPTVDRGVQILGAFNAVADALAPLDQEDRERVVRAVAILSGMNTR